MSRIKTANANIIKEYLKTLPSKSGVYQMFDYTHKCLYVGKAKDLRKRVINYTFINKLSTRIRNMILETSTMNHIVTKSEEEALLLEADLIKNLKPKYNILLRDDKSFPYLALSFDHAFPRLHKIKTKHAATKNLFGPFANSQILDELISFLQKTFKLRVCSDSAFNNRIRPCIYYQINRCSAPCVTKITKEDYQDSVNQTVALLQGNADNLKKELEQKMELASNNNNFELAIQYRNKLRMLSRLNLNYSVILPQAINADFITILKQDNVICVQVVVFKKGRSLGIKHYFPKHAEEETLSDILTNFIMQFYKNKELPAYIFCNILPNDKVVLIRALKLLSGTNTIIKLPPKTFNQITEFADNNIKIALEKEILSSTLWQQHFNNLSELLNININKIEVFDNSHFKGAGMLGAVIVANASGFNTKEYRIFKPKNQLLNKEDDYGTLKEVLTRRLKKLTNTNKENWPNLLIIDGGKSHLKIAIEAVKQLNLTDSIKVIAVAKGENRTFGKEKIILDNYKLLDLTNNDNLFKFILKLRDEAHRFAINSQRKTNLKNSTTSFLDNIPGVGKSKKQTLLLHFGSIEAIKAASAEHIHSTTRVGRKLSKKILEWLE